MPYSDGPHEDGKGAHGPFVFSVSVKRRTTQEQPAWLLSFSQVRASHNVDTVSRSGDKGEAVRVSSRRDQFSIGTKRRTMCICLCHACDVERIKKFE